MANEVTTEGSSNPVFAVLDLRHGFLDGWYANAESAIDSMARWSEEIGHNDLMVITIVKEQDGCDRYIRRSLVDRDGPYWS